MRGSLGQDQVGAVGEALLLYEPVKRRVVGASASALGLTGLGRDRLRGRLLDELLEVNGLYLGSSAEVLRRVSEVGREGGVYHASRGVFARRRGESPVPVALSASRARAGQVPLGLVALANPTADPSGGVSWSTGGEALDLFFALSSELCCVVGLDGCFLKASPAWEACTGHRPDQLVGRPLSRWVDPADLARVRRMLRRPDRAPAAAQFECRFRHRDGGVRRLTWRATFAGGLAYAVATEVSVASSMALSTGKIIPIATSGGVSGSIPAEIAAPRVLSAPSLSGLRLPGRVLLADDNADNRRIIGLRLGLAGAAVSLAADGLVALQEARAARAAGDPFQLVLLDMQMPVLDGFETVRRLRDEGFATPIVALSAHATPEDRADCLRFGCNGHVSKPIDWPALLSLLARLMSDETGSANALRVS